MNVQIDKNLHYHCVQCGRSCTGWNVWLKDELAERLKELPITLRVIQERGQAFEREDGTLKMFRNDQHPACGYLTPQKLCSIHSELGAQTKPKACRQFPYLMTQLPDGEIRVGASFCCTAVRGQLGPLLPKSRPEIEALIGEGAVIRSVTPSLPWEEIQAMEAEIEREQARSGWSQALESAMKSLTASDLPALPLVAQVMPMSLLKPCLYDTDRELWKRIDQGFMGACPLEIPEFGWHGSVAELDQKIVKLNFDAQIDDYLKALWFRKTHLLTNSLLSGLLLLWSLPGILRLLTALYAHRSCREPAPEHFSNALDAVEMSLVAHSGNGALVVEQMSQHLHHT
ncbi:YkgJ family cysteine cluster protein [bacterium]|nr:YkgJ family cysteine cluster protein [bacterium]